MRNCLTCWLLGSAILTACANPTVATSTDANVASPGAGLSQESTCVVPRKSGKKDGELVCTSSAGKITSRFHYKLGVRDGESVIYSHDGMVELRSHWKNNLLDGLSEYYDVNGKLIRIAHFKDGRLDGLSREWHANGKLKNSMVYQKNLLNGDYVEICDDGTIKTKGKMVLGVEQPGWQEAECPAAQPKNQN
jgi:antitoxin component YwqK of YwqJK toxin-antitoxin module